jgi:hypothetical protein
MPSRLTVAVLIMGIETEWTPSSRFRSEPLTSRLPTIWESAVSVSQNVVSRRDP